MLASRVRTYDGCESAMNVYTRTESLATIPVEYAPMYLAYVWFVIPLG